MGYQTHWTWAVQGLKPSTIVQCKNDTLPGDNM
jgi:hypothetical protein